MERLGRGAFYAWYAAIFGVVFLVTLYGLGAEPQTVRAKIEGLNGVLPAGAIRFLADQMQSVATAPALRLGTSLAFAFLIATGAAAFVIAALALALLLPQAVDGWALDPAVKAAISIARWPALAVLMWLALAALYRFAPCRQEPQWRWVSSGAAATAIWVLGSVGLSYIVTHFASGSAAFSALSAVLVMQTWFYITAVAVLLGTKLNAEAERQTTRSRVD